MRRYLFVFILLNLACNQGGTVDNVKDSAKQSATNSNTQPVETSGGISNPTETVDLLQGTWQHVEDPTNYLVFENNLRKEIAGNMPEWDTEEFILSDKCLNELDNGATANKEKGNYISCVQSDLCWYIEQIDKDNLVLSFMGRGNFLTYKRVKSRTFSQKFKIVDSLESKYQSCLDKGQAMPGCANSFYGQMDSLLNLQYRKLISQMGTAEGARLKNEQRQWIAERDKHFVLLKQQVHKEAVDNGFAGGQDEQMILTERKASYVKHRVVELLTMSVSAKSQYP